MCAIAVLARCLKIDAEKTRVLWLDRDAEQLALRGRGVRDCWIAAHLSTDMRWAQSWQTPKRRCAHRACPRRAPTCLKADGRSVSLRLTNKGKKAACTRSVRSS